MRVESPDARHDPPDTSRAEVGRPRRWLRDWRVWLGVAITLASLGIMVRGVPLGEVRAVMGGADLPLLLALSVPAYLASVWLRGLRWRHLTNPLAPLPRMALFRGEAIGFMVNNLVPLRIGEFVRSWYVAREAGISASAVLGTVVLERVLDIVSVLGIAAAALALQGAGAQDGVLARGVRWFIPVAIAPLVMLVLLRLAPRPITSLVVATVRPFSRRLADVVERGLVGFVRGLGAISRGSHLFWIVLHSALIWLVGSTLPIFAAVLAFDLDLGSPLQVLVVCWILLGATGVAVAIPSAPGFFGPYQLAYRAVLERFGVDPATALGIGLLVWAVFWVTLTLLGLVVLRTSHVRLLDLLSGRGKAPPPENR